MALQPHVRDFQRVNDRTNGFRDGRSRGVQWVERAEGEGAARMEEDTELEEGETLEVGPPLDDLDSRFGYLDTKIEAVLGHCQKEFQGSLHADILGSKFGGYGSFLPTHVRGAPVVTGPHQAPVIVAPRSRPAEGQTERGRRLSGTGSVAVIDRVPKASPNDIGTKSYLQINGVAQSLDGLPNASVRGNKMKDDQKRGRSITVRLNPQGQEADKVKKAMYNGFGLDHSSSPSTDEDPDDAVSASEDEVSPDRSPLDMIRIMTSHNLPLGGLLSPLPDLLSEPLGRKVKQSTRMNKKLAKGDNDMGKDGKVVKEKKEKAFEKMKGKVALDRREATQLLDSMKVSKKDMENDKRTGKEGGFNAPKVSQKIPAKDGAREVDLKGEKPDRDAAVNVGDVAGNEGENTKDLARSSRKEKVLSLELLKEDGIELPALENREVRKVKEDSIKESKKARETSVEPNLKDIVAKDILKERRRSGGNKDTLKVQREEETLQKDSQKQQYRKEPGKSVDAVVIEKEITRDGPSVVKKKGKVSSKGTQAQKEVKEKVKDSSKEARRETTKEISKKEMVLRDVDGSGKEDPKEFSKPNIQEIPKDALKDSVKRDATDLGLKEVKGGKKAGKKPKSVNRGKEKETGLARDVLGATGDGIGAQPPAPQPLPLPSAAGPSSETPAGAVPPAGLVLDHWVQCDKCQQWRLLIPGIDPADLPEKWLCKMMTWLPGLNSCKFSEDITTAAVYSYLGLQNPALTQANPGLQAPLPLPVPALAPLPEVMLDTKIPEAKPAKVQRSGSKKGMGKKAGAVKLSTPNVKRMEMGSVKSKSLNDVVQHPGDRVADRIGLEAPVEDVGYSRVMAEKRKLKEKEKLKRMRASEGDDMRPQKQTVREEERSRASGSWQDQEWGQLGKDSIKVPVALDAGNGAEGTDWIDSVDPEPNKQQKGRFLQDGIKPGGMGLKRRKKESSEEIDELRSGKRGKVEETWGGRGADMTARPKAYDDGDTHSLQYISDEGAIQEGESGDRVGVNSKSLARGTTSGQPPKKVKVTSTATRDRRNDWNRESLPDARTDEIKIKDHQNVKCKRDYFDKQESSDSDRDKYYREDPVRHTWDVKISRKAELKGRDSGPDDRKRMKGAEVESGHHTERKRTIFKLDVPDWRASREVMGDDKKGQVRRTGISSETEFHLDNNEEEQSRVAVSLKDDKDEDMRGKSARLFDEVSGIARTYVQSFEDRADKSPNGESPLPDMGTYNEAGRQTHRIGSRPRSPTSSSSKVSYSAESAFGSKGGSPIESTVSSSPVRSSKVDAADVGQSVAEGAQHNHATPHSQPSDKLNSVSPSPKRSGDQDADTHSDREGAVRQSHRIWDDRPHSSDPEREFRGSVRDPVRDTSSGRVRDDRYGTTNSREGADFRKFDRSRGGRDDDRYWEEARETRAGSTSYFVERYDRHRDDRYREREDSMDRDRYRETRYERRSSREDRFRDRDRDRERDRERGRSRENWATDRGGDGREERYSRERSVRQDRGGRPSSRESRLDKQGSLNWRDDARLVRDVGREGRDRAEDENAENKHEMRANHLEGSKDEHPGDDEHEAVPDVHKDDSGHRYDKFDLGPPKDAKSNFVRAPHPDKASHGWEGDRVAVGSTGRKDSDAGAPRNGLEVQTMTTHVNSRSRVEGPQSGLGSMGASGKTGLVDSAAQDLRIVEGSKQSKEVRGADEDSSKRVSVAKAIHSSGHNMRGPEGASSSPSKKEHTALAQGLMKDAKDLKHSADRLKSASMEGESTNLYLQAALKFLQAAHHLEMASMESLRQGESTQSMLMYNDTARLCDFCATTYERQKDLAAAALAHICAAVARFRVTMSKSGTLNKDCTELQNAASSAAAPGSQVAAVLTPPTGLPPPPALPRISEKPGSSHGAGAPPAVGESPSSSSSASDVDNLNNHAVAGDRGLATNALKGAAPSPTPGSTSGSTDLVPQRLHANFHRMIRNGMDVFVMMESWTKAQIATAAAESASVGFPRRVEGMLAVRRVGEIGLLGNMDAVVRQVRLALEAIGH